MNHLFLFQRERKYNYFTSINICRHCFENQLVIYWVKAAYKLPEGYKLLIVTRIGLFRCNGHCGGTDCPWQMAKAHPFQMVFQYWKWRKTASQYTAPPGGSSHQCGAAVDLTILDDHNTRLDMGTSFTDFGKKVHTYSDLISDEQRKNRKMLFDLMTETGFINYPLEWWHYSYGDRMWAAYSGQKKCFYGPIN